MNSQTFEILARFVLPQLSPDQRPTFLQLAERHVTEISDSFMDVAAIAGSEQRKVARLTNQVDGYNRIFLKLIDFGRDNGIEGLTPILIEWINFTQEQDVPLDGISEVRAKLLNQYKSAPPPF